MTDRDVIASPATRLIQTRVQSWLRVEHSSKARVYSLVSGSAELGNISYWLEILFSAAIATLGLVLNSPAVIIGAMLISPLMGPIMATGLALSVGDLYLTIRALGSLLLSIGLSVALSAGIVWMLPFHSPTAEVIARTQPNLLDLAVAIFSGLAGSVLVCRSGSGSEVTALPGVAIAVALMPPLCTVGFGLGSDGSSGIVRGAALLFLTNLVAIVSSGFLVFLLIGMNSPEVMKLRSTQLHGNALANWLSESSVARAFGERNGLRWRILLLLVLLASVAVPLRQALLQVTSETRARAAIQSALSRLAPDGTLVSRQVSLDPHAVLVHLISTRPIAAKQVHDTETSLTSHIGRPVSIAVQEVASRGDVSQILARLASTPPPSIPAPAPPLPPSLESVGEDLVARLNPALQAAWPSGVVLKDSALAFSPAGVACTLTYTAPHPLDPVALTLVERALRERLQTPQLTLLATWSRAGKAKARSRTH